MAVFKFGEENLPEEIKQKTKIAKEIFKELFGGKKKYSLFLQQIGEKKISFLMRELEIILNFCQNEEKEKREVFEKRWIAEQKRVYK